LLCEEKAYRHLATPGLVPTGILTALSLLQSSNPSARCCYLCIPFQSNALFIPGPFGLNPSSYLPQIQLNAYAGPPPTRPTARASPEIRGGRGQSSHLHRLTLLHSVSHFSYIQADTWISQTHTSQHIAFPSSINQGSADSSRSVLVLIPASSCPISIQHNLFLHPFTVALHSLTLLLLPTSTNHNGQHNRQHRSRCPDHPCRGHHHPSPRDDHCKCMRALPISIHA